MLNKKSLLLILTVILISCGGNGGNSSPDPEITSIQPDSGPAGTMVTIEGKDFSTETSNNTVTFGGITASVTSSTESELQVTVPELDPGSAQVEVTVGNQTVTGPAFTVEQGAPGISSVDPQSGTVGTEVTIKGTNFSTSASENNVSFNGTRAQVLGAAQDQLITEVPQGATDGPIEVTVAQKVATGPNFDVITEGTAEFLFSRTGSPQDPDGYILNFNNEQTNISSTTSKLTKGAVEEGSYQAELTDLADNCTLSGQNPRSVDIVAGDTTTTTFEISCVETRLKDEIIFSSNRDGDMEIFVMDIDGSNKVQLTDNTDSDEGAAISNDGKKIAFVSDRNGSNKLFTMNFDGSNITELNFAVQVRGNNYDWSPDNSKIVFSGTPFGESTEEVFTINADGSNLQRLTNDSFDNSDPDWSPDGSQIAFSSNRNGGSEIYVMGTDGSNIQALTSVGAFNNSPSWSPDGSKVAFSSSSSGSYQVHTMDADGSNLSQLTTDGGSNPNWSPDGNQLVFESNRTGDFDIYKIDSSGSVINLTQNNSTNDRNPLWSPVQ